MDWTNPDEWIVERLQGHSRALAEAIWQKTQGKVNPRHTYGHWLLACNYHLLEEDDSGRMMLSELGRDFIACEQGDAALLIDEGEGLLQLLTIVAEKGTGRRGDFIAEWSEYLQRYSKFGTDSTIKDTLWRRLIAMESAQFQR